MTRTPGTSSPLSLLRRSAWLRRLAALALALAALPTLLGAMGGPGALGPHCAGHHAHTPGHGASLVSHSVAAQAAVGDSGAGPEQGCPHCPAAQCAGAPICTAGMGTVMPSRSPVLAESSSHVMRAAATPALPRSFVFQPLTPPPIA